MQRRKVSRPVEAPHRAAKSFGPWRGDPTSGHRGVFSRMGRNILWLLGGRGFSGLASIGYLGLAARALGPATFGTFSLVLAYGGSLAALAQFRSWQAVIRYGSIHLAEGRNDRLPRLVGFTATLDWAAALVGVVVAGLAAQLAGPLLGWTHDQRWGAAAFASVLLLTTGATATGVLRLFDRYDLLSGAEAVGPAVRLVGAALVWWFGGGLAAMLVAWAAAAVLENGAQWLAALRIRRTRIELGRSAFSAALRENPRIWGFMAQNSFSSSLGILGERLGTLVVGSAGGAVAAGAFRVSSKLAGGLAKPADALTRVLFPELVRLATSDDRETLARVTLRTTWVALGVAAAMTALVLLAGPAMLRLFFGRPFAEAQPYLLLLTLAAAIDLCGIALEPMLNAHGLSGQVLKARSAGAVAYLVVVAILVPLAGAVAAAAAAIASALAVRVSLAVAARRLLSGSSPVPVSGTLPPEKDGTR